MTRALRRPFFSISMVTGSREHLYSLFTNVLESLIVWNWVLARVYLGYLSWEGDLG